jgi:hypothetical protein
MNTTRPSESNLTAYFAGVLGALLIVALLVWSIYRYAHPAPLGANRAEERRKNLADNRQANATLDQYGWADAGKGFVRLPISEAMRATIKDYQNVEAAKKEIAARVDKAAAAPPEAPKAPEQPSKYE